MNLLGARGIEGIITVPASGSASLNWLMVDGHGNIVRTIDTSFTLSAYQWRGVWGERQTGTLQVGKGYCANLGHQEDETGLVYMRARYYEPTTGRFITEDPLRADSNQYFYTRANPVRYVDSTGLFVDPGAGESLEANLERSGEAARQGSWMTNKINHIFDIVRQQTGMSRQQFRELVHQLKKEMQMGPKDDILLDKRTGKLFRETGEGLEELGHWMDFFLL